MILMTRPKDAVLSKRIEFKSKVCKLNSLEVKTLIEQGPMLFQILFANLTKDGKELTQQFFIFNMDLKDVIDRW